jgi:hypothetical protein
LRQSKVMQHMLIGATAALIVGGRFIGGNEESGPVLAKAAEIVAPQAATVAVDTTALVTGVADGDVDTRSEAHSALEALAPSVTGLSHPQALQRAFESYYAFKAQHPEAVTKPYLYFVDYGQPSTAKRGYLFDMAALTIVDGPFTVAHGRGSSVSKYGIPTRFSNASGSAATSLGLFLAQETYGFSGHAGGALYHSIGLRLKGLSGNWNDNARARGVVAHGAPYVTASASGRSEGCPAMEQSRAKRLLPKLANGGLVFLFAPNEQWMKSDPWLVAAAKSVVGALSAN